MIIRGKASENKTSAAWNKQLRKLLFLLLYPMALLLKELAAKNSGAVESIYSRHIYPVVSQAVGFLFGLASFSVAEILLYAGIVGLAAYILVQLFFLFRKKERPLRACRLVLNLSVTASVGYFLFISLWGLNYYRQPLATTLQYNVAPRSVSDLTQLCTTLTSRANALRPLLQEDSNGDMKLKQGKDASLRNIPAAYQALSKEYPVFSGHYGAPKPVLLSRYMSYTQTSGIFIPFTVEPNVNTDMPDALLYATAGHEAAHQHGFAREDEANFISYLACNASGNPEMQYSGTLLALITSMNALSTYDADAYWKIVSSYDPGVLRDMQEDTRYWHQFDGPVAETSTKVNNAYLKSNKQTDGVNSYGRMVDLLLAEMQKNQGSASPK